MLNFSPIIKIRANKFRFVFLKYFFVYKLPDRLVSERTNVDNDIIKKKNKTKPMSPSKKLKQKLA